MLRADAEHGNLFVEPFIVRVVTFRPLVRSNDPVVNLLIYCQGMSVNSSGIPSQGTPSLPIQIHPNRGAHHASSKSGCVPMLLHHACSL